MEPEDKRKLEEVYAFMQSLKSSSTIPLQVDRAFRDRFRDILVLSVSAKGADTEDVSINEGGASTHVVMDDPDGFLQVTLAGTPFYIPYFSS